MATQDTVDSVHRDVYTLVSAGSIAALLGFSSYFMSFEYSDFDRVNFADQGHAETTFQRRKKLSLVVLIISAFFYVCGIVLLTVGISLYRNERTEIANSITGIITQAQQQAQQPNVNEPAILASVSAAIIILGMIQSARHFRKTESFGWLGSLIYAVGWLMFAFAGASNDNSLSSIRGDRLAFTLIGSSLVVAGTWIFPWALHPNFL